MPLVATRGAASAQGFGEFAQATAVNYIEEVFSTYLYTGNGNSSPLTITNGIDLSTKGGLVWVKDRTSVNDFALVDTVRGAYNTLKSNTTDASASLSTITGFNTTGFNLGGSVTANANGDNYVSLTLRKQPKFFDIVTFSGNSSNRTISHNLGSTPGCIFVKCTSQDTGGWQVYHRGMTSAAYSMNLNGTGQESSQPTVWNSTAPTSTVFSVGTAATVNQSGDTYVAYLFAHNAGGFGLTGTDNVISCGSYVVSGGSATINLGYEPQFVLTKASSATGNWLLLDNMRQFDTGGATFLSANTTAAETGYSVSRKLTNTGFTLSGATDGTYIYIAIRRGPMKVPTSGTSVFTPLSYTNSTGGVTISSLTYPADLVITDRKDTSSHRAVWDRLRGATKAVYTNLTNAEGTAGDGLSSFASNVGYTTGSGGVADNTVDGSQINWVFKRAPSFFDEVCYTGTGSLRTVSHNLGAVPELLIVKRRDTAEDWNVYSAATGNAAYLRLNTTAAVGTAGADALWGSTTPTSSVFTVKTSGGTNASGGTFVAYLFATCAGVSKMTTFTGNGSSQTINCGFTGGARFVLIKRVDSTGNWVTFDTARGIVSGNDPALYLNSTAAEVTGVDAIDPDSTGFIVNQESTFNLNVSSATYLVLAIA